MEALSDLFFKLEELTEHVLKHMQFLWAELECLCWKCVLPFSFSGHCLRCLCTAGILRVVWELFGQEKA